MNLIALTEEEAAIVAAFQRSPECRRARLPYRLVWVSALLDCMTAARLGWADLDLPALRAILTDGMRWTIARPPASPRLVARELHAFVRWAARALGHPHAAACCAYLRSARAATDIHRGVVPLRAETVASASASNSC